MGAVAAADERDGEVAAGGERLRGGARPHLAAVLVEGDVAHPVDAVLDAPMPAVRRSRLAASARAGGALVTA